MAISELQLALIGIGATAVASVWGYNKWQERKLRQHAESILHPGVQEDVLLDEADSHGEQPAYARIEPGDGPAIDRIEPILPPAEAMADEQGSTFSPAPSAAPASAAAPIEIVSPWADPVADSVVRIDFPVLVSAPILWAAQAGWVGQIGKPVHWVGLNAGEWRKLTAHDAGSYASVAAAVQLADRRGVVADTELAMFFDGCRQVAAQLGGEIQVPDSSVVLAHARALDEFCASVDVQLTINIVDPGGMAFAGTKLRGLAEAVGMQLVGDGRYHFRDDDGHTLYTLGNMGADLFDADSLRTLATHGVTLTLDVPNIGQGARIYDRMVAAARQFAQGLGGVLVDAQRAPLSAEMISGIRGKIDEIQKTMAANQIVAGSERARRLFS